MSLAEMLDVEAEPTVDFAQLVKIVTPMSCKKLKRPEVVDTTVRGVKAF